jgi:hypothetical protein
MLSCLLLLCRTREPPEGKRVASPDSSLKRKTFDFEVPSIQIHRNDILQLREKLESITLEERKSLGINKSTLWYMKRNLKNNKNFKIYNKSLAKIR